MPAARVENPSYETVHTRLTREKGAAKSQPCFECGKKAENWSYDHQDPDEVFSEDGKPYSKKAEHYQALCVTCHRHRDRSEKCRNGHKYTEKNTYISKDGFRYCRECRRIYSNDYYHRKVKVKWLT